MYTKKRIINDWNGNVKRLVEWIEENPDIIRPWEGEPGTTLIKALDYDPVVEDTEAAMASAVYEHTASGRGAVIAKTTARGIFFIGLWA